MNSMQPVKLLEMLYLHQKRMALFLATNMFWVKKSKVKPWQLNLIAVHSSPVRLPLHRWMENAVGLKALQLKEIAQLRCFSDLVFVICFFNGREAMHLRFSSNYKETLYFSEIWSLDSIPYSFQELEIKWFSISQLLLFYGWKKWKKLEEDLVIHHLAMLSSRILNSTSSH